MTLKTNTLTYSNNITTFEAYYAYDDRTTEQRPAVLVAHDWSGKNNFAKQKADALAQLGYVGFALDMFGEGKTGQSKEEKTALIQPLLQHRTQLMERMTLALHAVQTLDIVDHNHIGAIGFCFGGLCVLDLARTGVAIKGVVSFHGLLIPADHVTPKPIRAKVLALHGYDDPMAPPDQVIQFADEMTRAKADWQLNMYGNTLHAFMNPDANDKNFGTVYQETTAKRAWLAMEHFFKDIFRHSG